MLLITFNISQCGLTTRYLFPPAQQCSEGWSQVGEACLRINSSRESYDNAQHYCKNLNGNIASLTTSKQVDFVLEELKKLQHEEMVQKNKQINK